MQSYQKFGTRIKPVIENEFREIILPNIEKALTGSGFPISRRGYKKPHHLLNAWCRANQRRYLILTNSDSGKDILRFHVRRDNPPQAGYWFNFHYHTYHDGFQSHHELGSIYWEKIHHPNG